MASGSDQLPASMTAISNLGTTTDTEEMPLCDSQLNDEAIGSILRARESNKKPEVDSLRATLEKPFSSCSCGTNY